MQYNFPQPLFNRLIAECPHPAVFVTVSGAHLYGFPSADSDFDLRGSHLLPGRELWRLDAPRETEQAELNAEGELVEMVSHDLRKFVTLLLKKNGYVLEQLTSPLVIRTSPAHAALLRHVPGVLTRNHYHHYRGFYHNERRDYERSEPRSAKKLLYCYRVLMTGIVLLREGVVEANLQALNQRFGLGLLEELVRIKAAEELIGLPADNPFTARLDELEAELDRAYAESTLPETPPAREELDRLIVNVREYGVEWSGK